MAENGIDLDAAEKNYMRNAAAMQSAMRTAVEAGEGWCIAREFEEAALRHPAQECIRFVDTNASYSFLDVSRRTDRIAAAALRLGLSAGDTVALFLTNRPEVFFLWLGLSKAGIVSALVNFNLTGRPLAHSIRVAHCSAVIVGKELANAVGEELRNALNDCNLSYYSVGGAITAMKDFDAEVKRQVQPSRTDIHALTATVKATDRLFLMYTSGTTGHPKAAIMTHLRFFAIGVSYSLDFDMTARDRIYCALPLYHASGGAIGVGMMISSGAALIVRSKFSARAFWSDVHDNQCTVIQYIGELCRYLLQAHRRGIHSSTVLSSPEWQGIRIAIGNGLSPEIWEQFQSTFNVKRVGEIYGATESICGMKNSPGKVGAIGFIPRAIQADPSFGTRLIRYDVENDDVVRTADGLCVECEPGEVGQVVGRIMSDVPIKAFVGYTDQKESSKKVLENVLERGDKFFASGDLLRSDENGFFYFVDRIGDTFRWKGENVSTGEVAMVLNDVTGVIEANVYGVKVPSCDGRAGMAAIRVDDKAFSMTSLCTSVRRELPSYAQPLFVRILSDMEVTSTFKLKKHKLREEGFDITIVKDELFVLDQRSERYEPLTTERYRRIVAGQPSARL